MNNQLNSIYSRAMAIFNILYAQRLEKNNKIDLKLDCDQEFQLKYLILCQKILDKEEIKPKAKPNWLTFSTQELDMKEGFLNLFPKDKAQHWEIINQNTAKTNKKDLHIRIGFLGNYNSGKTFLLNQLFTLSKGLAHTKNISEISLDNYSSIKIIDTPGLRNPNIKDKNESKNRDFFIKKLVLTHCNLVFYLITSYDLTAQKDLEEIKKECIVSKANLIIVHNLFEIQSKEDYDYFIKFNLLLRDNVIQCKYAVSELKENREIIHFVIGHSSTCIVYADIIERIKQQIQVTKGIPSFSFQERVKSTIAKTSPVMFKGLSDDAVNTFKDNNDLYMDCPNAELNIYDKDLYEKSEGRIDNYGYYIDNNELVIELEMVQFSEFKLKVDIIGQYTVFNITAKKNSGSIQAKNYSKCSMYLEDYSICIKIPLSEAVLSSKQVKEKSNEQGLLKLRFSLLTD